MRAAKGPYTTCDLCREFEPHIHPERLEHPRKKRTPGVVLVNFTADTFDPAQSRAYPQLVFDAAGEGPQHNYVFLTKQLEEMQKRLPEKVSPHWWFGLTLCNQGQVDGKFDDFAKMMNIRKWLSIEPLWSPIDLGPRLELMEGVIVGHDNRKQKQDKIPNYVGVTSVVEQCIAARVPVFVKQLWVSEDDRTVCTEPDRFPIHLQHRQLAWCMPGQHPQRRVMQMSLFTPPPGDKPHLMMPEPKTVKIPDPPANAILPADEVRFSNQEAALQEILKELGPMTRLAIEAEMKARGFPTLAFTARVSDLRKKLRIVGKDIPPPKRGKGGGANVYCLVTL